MTRRSRWGTGTLGLLLAVGLLAAPASAASAAPAARTVYVGQCVGPSPYSTIQSAVDAATPGTVVLVCPAVYPEQVRIVGRPRLTISAPAGAVVDTTRLLGLPLRAEDSPRLTLSGLTLRSSTGGAEVTSSRGTRVQGMRFETGGDGLFLLDSPGSRVAGNAVQYARGGLGLGLGIGVSRGDGTQVLRNTVEGGGTGFTVYETTGLRVVGNSFTGRWPNPDVRDTTSGSGTAGTASTWVRNRCVTSVPAGLCSAPRG